MQLLTIKEKPGLGQEQRLPAREGVDPQTEHSLCLPKIVEDGLKTLGGGRKGWSRSRGRMGTVMPTQKANYLLKMQRWGEHCQVQTRMLSPRLRWAGTVGGLN